MLKQRFRLPALAICLSAGGGAGVADAACVQLAEPLPPLADVDDPRLILDADQVDLSDEGLSRLMGSVRLRYGDKEFKADELEFDEQQQAVEVKSESTFRNNELLIRSQSSRFDLDDETGRFEGNEFVLPERSARGDADAVMLRRDGTARLEDVRFTTCAPDSDAWYLEAGSIKLDQEEGLGTARNARLRFYQVPILYAPWFQFPIDDRRRTGLLFPVVGESDKTGWDLRAPVYFNLAPNYDMTLTPRYMSDRGTQLQGTGRYVTGSSEGSLGSEWLPDDRMTGERRTYATFNHRGVLTPQLGLDVRYAEVSDRRYFEDLGGTIDLSSITHLERSARLTYAAPASYTVRMLFQDYQTIASGLTQVDDPYQRLPQIRIDAITRNAVLDTRLGGEVEYVNFVRSESVQAQRVDMHPYLRMEKDEVSWFTTSQLDFRYTAYALSDTQPGQDSDLDRALPSFSTEFGLRFERLAASGAPQTLEPRLFYLYVPYEDQDDLPIFDSGEPDFDFTQLFSRNRFSGADRVSDANQFAVALTGRELDPETGTVRARATVGQLFRFETPRVQLPGESAPNRGATDFIGSLDYDLIENLTLRMDTQWSPENAEFTRTSAGLRWRRDARMVEVAYRYRQGLLEQTDLIVQTPLYAGLSMVGRWRYSVRDRSSLDTVASVQYETCCWALRTSYRRYVADSRGNFNAGVYVQLELKGLARIGSGLTNLFPASMVE